MSERRLFAPLSLWERGRGEGFIISQPVMLEVILRSVSYTMLFDLENTV